MGLGELAILLGGGVVGWLAVSWVITIVRQQRAPSVIVLPESRPSPSEAARSKDPSLSQLADTWHTLLRVGADASVGEIEAAYHERIAECDRIRFARDAADAERKEAEQNRSNIEEAYAFIRTIKGVVRSSER